ncbi:MAG: NAD-dependent protein deacetylase [Kofleriaceae bacterium]
MDPQLVRLVELVRGNRVAVLTGAGCSTESGIPDYRGQGAPPRTRPAIQHREFVDHAHVRQRYWARSMLGWPRFARARPNDAHHALAMLEQRDRLAGIITQNVDGLHHAAGSAGVVELHGALARVRCLGCHAITTRDDLQARLAAANRAWAARVTEVEVAPDGDAELPEGLIHEFTVVDCAGCGGALMPDVVMFGGNVARRTLDAAWETFERGDVLLVVGSSLAVFSGYRFVRRAAECGMPIAIVNRGPTRGDEHAAIRLDALAGPTLLALAATA